MATDAVGAVFLQVSGTLPRLWADGLPHGVQAGLLAPGCSRGREDSACAARPGPGQLAQRAGRVLRLGLGGTRLGLRTESVRCNSVQVGVPWQPHPLIALCAASPPLRHPRHRQQRAPFQCSRVQEREPDCHGHRRCWGEDGVREVHRLDARCMQTYERSARRAAALGEMMMMVVFVGVGHRTLEEPAAHSVRQRATVIYLCKDQ